MKHIMAIAELNGWVVALAEASISGKITVEAGDYLATRSGELTRQYLKGELPWPKTVEADEEAFEALSEEFGLEHAND